MRFARLRAGLRRKEGAFVLLTGHSFRNAQARARNAPGYYRSSLAGLKYCGRKLDVFLDAGYQRNPTPGASPGVSFCCAGATRYGSPQGFRAAGLRKVTAAAKARGL